MLFKPYEIHITGSENILQACNELKLKSITIDSLCPLGKNIKREYMTSIRRYYENNKDALKYIHTLVSYFISFGVSIYRCKLETVLDNRLNPEDLIYIESHWKDISFKYPTSKQPCKSEYIATDRLYDLDCDKINAFVKSHKGHEIEACIYDTNIHLDDKWVSLYK